MRNKFRLYITVIFLLFSVQCWSQEIPGTEELLEKQAEDPAGETGEDEYQAVLEPFRLRPIDLNQATGADLEQLQLLTPLQIAQLLRYRKLNGPFLSVYELQAVPGWDVGLLQRIRPFIKSGKLNENGSVYEQVNEAQQRLLMRYVRVLEKADGYYNDSSGSKYKGSAGQLQLRYLIRFKKEWQMGWMGEKDAGESFTVKGPVKGFDFYSFHVFLRNRGRFTAVALGDFTVCMGQGLIQWQGMGTGISAAVMNTVRNAAVLKPYQSAGEFNFFRGAGCTYNSGRNSISLFASIRHKDANGVRDSSGHLISFSSWNSSGLHRTEAEMEDRHLVPERAAGLVLSRGWQHMKLSLNGIWYHFGLPLQKRDEPYNQYAWKGDEWYNGSISWGGNLRNLYVFGEFAAGKNGGKAILAGLQMSVDMKADLSLIYRDIGKDFQSIAGNAFTENSLPVNEQGIYIGICLRPAMGWTCNAYADLYRFPWMKYSADGASVGSGYLFEVNFKPDKQTEIYSRFRYSGSEENEKEPGTEPGLVWRQRTTWRTQISYRLNRDLSLRGRVELSGFKKGVAGKEGGYLWFADGIYKPLGASFSACLRFLYFNTDSYDSRIYAYENDVIYSYSLPGFSGKGLKSYLLISGAITRKINFWLRIGRQKVYGNGGIGSGTEKLPGNTRTDLKFEVRWGF